MAPDSEPSQRRLSVSSDSVKPTDAQGNGSEPARAWPGMHARERESRSTKRVDNPKRCTHRTGVDVKTCYTPAKGRITQTVRHKLGTSQILSVQNLIVHMCVNVCGRTVY